MSTTVVEITGGIIARNVFDIFEDSILVRESYCFILCDVIDMVGTGTGREDDAFPEIQPPLFQEPNISHQCVLRTFLSLGSVPHRCLEYALAGALSRLLFDGALVSICLFGLLFRGPTFCSLKTLAQYKLS